MLLDQIKEKAGGGLDKLRLYSAVVTKKDRTLDLCFAFPEKLTEEQEELIKDVCVRSVAPMPTLAIASRSRVMPSLEILSSIQYQ